MSDDDGVISNAEAVRLYDEGLRRAVSQHDPPRDLLRCPIHGIPDCSPLLNGCFIPNRIAAAYAEGWSAALADQRQRKVRASIDPEGEPRPGSMD